MTTEEDRHNGPLAELLREAIRIIGYGGMANGASPALRQWAKEHAEREAARHPPSARAFRKRLYVLAGLSPADLISAGVLDEDDIGRKIDFTANPHLFAMRTSEENFAKLWALMQQKGGE
jgi:hypothetical protein